MEAEDTLGLSKASAMKKSFKLKKNPTTKQPSVMPLSSCVKTSLMNSLAEASVMNFYVYSNEKSKLLVNDGCLAEVATLIVFPAEDDILQQIDAMGSYLDKPKTDKQNENGNGNGLSYGIASMQGWRQEMEDAHKAIIGLSDIGIPGADFLKDWSFFAVFDGHCGAKVSAYCAEHLLESILQTEEFKRSDFVRGIRSGFLMLDNNMRSLPGLASGEDKSGSTAVCALISPQQIYIANCGDSRALLCRDGHPHLSTQDHKPGIPMEQERIHKAGGTVMIERVNGSLAVSRALGDYEYKNVEGKGPCEQLVSPEPEIYVLDRCEESDEFLILACDGIWDVMSNKNLCDFVRSRLLISDDLQHICNQVVNTCLYKGSRDNMSIVLVTFPAAPKVSEEAVQKERELEVMLEKRIRYLIDNQQARSFRAVLNAIDEECIPNLPPGGDLHSKRDFIEKIYKEIHPHPGESEGMDIY